MQTWLALVAITILQARAEVPTVPLACEYAQTLHAPVSFPEVEFINRRPDYGQLRTGAVTLNPRVDVGENAWIGVDQDHRLLNVVRVNGRTMAFLLSGERKIRDIFFRPPTTLVALDGEGALLQFSWLNGELPRFARLRARLPFLGSAVCAVGALVGVYALAFQVPPTEIDVWLSALFGTVGVTMAQGFAAINTFDVRNQVTDGMRDLGVRVPEFRISDFDREDYRLHTRREELSLNALVGDRLQPALQGFGADCAYALIPDGKGGDY